MDVSISMTFPIWEAVLGDALTFRIVLSSTDAVYVIGLVIGLLASQNSSLYF